MLLVLTCLAIATHTAVSLPQPESQLTARKEALEAEDAERSNVAEDSTEEEATYDEYLKLCNTLGIPPISVGSGYGYTAPYTNYGGSSNYGRYPSYGGYSSYGRPNGYGGYPSYTYPSSTGGYSYYRGNAAGRSAGTEATAASEEDVEASYDEYLKLCSTLGIPPISVGSGYTAPYTNYGGSSNYNYGRYPSYGYNGYNGYGGYPSYTYPVSTGGYTYYRGTAAGRSAEAEATEEDVEATYAEYVRVCSNLGIPPVSIGSGYTNYGGSSAYGGYGGYPVYGGNTGYVSNYGYTGYPAYSTGYG